MSFLRFLRFAFGMTSTRIVSYRTNVRYLFFRVLRFFAYKTPSPCGYSLFIKRESFARLL